MLVSTLRGYFRRIFRVEELIEEIRERLVDEERFLSSGTTANPGRVARINVTIGSTDTLVDVSYPEHLLSHVGAGSLFAAITPVLGDMGSATHAWIDVADSEGDFSVRVDAAPGKSVELSLLLFMLPV